MPSAGEHEAPLRLRCGEDAFLAWLTRTLALAGIATLLLAPLPAATRFALLAATAAGWFGLELRYRKRVPGCLVLHPDGRCELDGQPARLDPTGWISARFSVIRVLAGTRHHSLVVTASRQAPGEYRKLLAWMRLQPWNLAE